MTKQANGNKAKWIHNPDWEIPYLEHVQAYDTLLEVDEPTREQEADLSRHRQAYEQAFASQFKTAGAYVQNKLCCLKNSAKEYDLSWMAIDTSAVKTKEKADALIEKASALYRQQRSSQTKSLPVSKKPLAFAKGKAELVNANLYLPRKEAYLDLLMCVEETAKGLNVCLAEQYTSKHPVNLNTETTMVANALYDHLLSGYPQVQTQKDINWYVHVSPSKAVHRESFIALGMEYDEDGRYAYANYHYQNDVPQEIKISEFKAAFNEINSVMIDPRKASYTAQNAPA